MIKKHIYILLTILIVISLSQCVGYESDYSTDQTTIAQGKDLFAKNCISCHGLNQDGFGPKLGGATTLLSKDYLVNFIKDPQKAIDTEERATHLHERYKRTMPSFDWMDDGQISAILSYVDQQTKLHSIEALILDQNNSADKLTGNLVDPIQMSNIKIELEDVIHIPPMAGGLDDLGIVTLRPHPSKDGSLFINDQNGILYKIINGKATAWLDARDHIADFQNGPGIATGLGSFDFHPDFLNNGLLYIFHAEEAKGQKTDHSIYNDTQSEVQWILSEWKVDDVYASKFAGTHREMLRTHAPHFAHGAQEIAFIPGLDKDDPDYGLMYLSYGDGGSNNIAQPELCHNLKSYLGTILRIDPLGNNSPNGNYGIPSDNPFVHETEPGILKEIYAYGFRNPHRMTWDQTNENRMIVTDIGEANIEELNIVTNGGDYGWPKREGTFGISTTVDVKTVYELDKSDIGLYDLPYAQYDHEDGNAISGGYVYDGDIELLQGKYVFGDIVNGKLFYTNVDPALSDSTIYELTIIDNNEETTLKELSNSDRLHLRIGYDHHTKQLYLISKADKMIRRISKAWVPS